MEQILANPNFVREKILYEYFRGTPRVDTHKYFLEVHTRSGGVFPMVSYLEVDFWYTKFENGDFNLGQEIRINRSSREFIDFPDNVLTDIFARVELNDQKSLQLTCRKLRTFIEKEERSYDTIIVFLNSGSIYEQKKLIHSGLDRKKFESNNGGCTITENAVTKSSEKSYIHEALSSFHELIKKPNTKISKLAIITDSNNAGMSELRDEFFTKIHRILKSLKSNLHVEWLDMWTANQEEFLAVMSNLMPGTLSKLSLKTLYSSTTWEVNEILKLPHWAHIKSVSIYGDQLNFSMDDFAHMQFVEAPLKSIYPGEVANYTNKLRANRTLQKHSFTVKKRICQFSIKAALWPWVHYELQPLLGSFSMTGCQTDRLHIKVEGEGITFNKI